MRVHPDRVESELARLWDADALARRAWRAELVNLVTFVSTPALLGGALSTIARVGQAIPSRSVTVSWEPSPDEPTDLSPEAEVALQRAPGGRAVGDSVLLRARGTARTSIVERVEQLLLVGVPACIWWVGELGPLHDVFGRLAHRAELLVVDSAEMCVNDFESLARVALGGQTHCPVADLTWTRLEPIRELIARFFDDPKLIPCLDELSQVTIAYAPRPGDSGVVSAEGALFIGGLVAAMGLEPASARWTRERDRSEGLVRRRAKPERVVVRIEGEQRAGVPHGTLLSVQLVCGDARFAVARLRDDSSLLRSSCQARSALVPSHLSRIPLRDSGSLLASHLRNRARDRMFDASLEMARMLFGSSCPSAVRRA